ncbi:hypothetical protein DFS34DRAFT_653324 [Phlyctochytrium arcticum]|nr:hypothetical protein DFS34DRAFT_653324 [Phlyctochytrium arcticum]
MSSPLVKIGKVLGVGVVAMWAGYALQSWSYRTTQTGYKARLEYGKDFTTEKILERWDKDRIEAREAATRMGENVIS